MTESEWKDERKKAVQRKRAIPQMPEGYYSGDKPNPNMRAFVEAHLLERPYDPETDKYNVPAFDHAIETTKATAIYNMHSYHQGKKPHDAIRQYIRHYTKPGDLVLDPFCGSGGTALAALMEGCKAIAIDRSPAATFITKNYCTPVDVDELQAAFEELKKKMKPEIDWLYETRCDRCGGKATTGYTVYSQVFQCPRCMEKVALFDCIEVEGRTQKGKPKKIRVCPNCMKRDIQEQIKSTGEHFGSLPVLVSYLCKNGCKPARNERRHDDDNPRKREFFERYDLSKIKDIEGREIPYWYPDEDLAKAIPYRMLYKKDFRPVDASRLKDLFTKRNLWALAAIRNEASKLSGSDCKDLALLGLTGTILHLSRMSHHKEGGGGIMVGTYYLPQICKERNAFVNYSDKSKEILQAITIITLTSRI